MSYKLQNDIRVTRDLLESAKRTSSRSCAIQAGIKDQNPHLTRIEVGPQWISFTDPRRGKRYHCITPASAFEYFLNWDAGFNPEPFTVRLRVTRTTEPRKNTQIADSQPAKSKKRRRQRTRVATHARQQVIHSDRIPGREPRTYRRREWGAKVFLATASKLAAAQAQAPTA